MKQELVNILACPVCKGELVLQVKAEDGGEVISGLLHCAKCGAGYPVNEGIPNLLPPQQR